MLNNQHIGTRRWDHLLQEIAAYVTQTPSISKDALQNARYCLMDSLGCALLALNYPACTKLLGPIVPGAVMPNGCRVPGTSYELDPVQAAFHISTLIRWLDFNDAWGGAEPAHPSDNIGGILAMADYLSRKAVAEGKPALTIKDVLIAMVKAYEIQGVLAIDNAFNRVGLDHVILVRIASAAVITGMLGGTQEQIQHAVSQAWIDGGALRLYRQAPNTGSRKGWAAGNATSRGVWLSLMTMRGEQGYFSAITEPRWGFQDVLFKGQTITLSQPLASYIMERILYKVAFPAEGYTQTACEAAVKLHPSVKDRLDDIEKIVIKTQEPVMRITNKTGPLTSPADRDHCIQYVVAICLMKGDLQANDYEDDVASDPRIDILREKMEVVENTQFTEDYFNPEKRAIANSIQVFFKGGERTDHVVVEYPIGHYRRHKESIPALEAKFKQNIATRLSPETCSELIELFADPTSLERIDVHDFMRLLYI